MSIAKHTYTKMNQDISKSKFSPQIYYEGSNIRIITNEAFGSITNAKGNELIVTIPDILSNPTQTKTRLNNTSYPLTNPTLLGHTYINEDLYLLSKYESKNETAKLFYAQSQSINPYIDSNIRVSLKQNGSFQTYFENFDSTNGAIEGPSLPVGTEVEIRAFSFASEPNEPAPNPTLYLEIYKNGSLIEKLSTPLDYINTIDVIYTFTTEANAVYYFSAYSLPEPGPFPNPFLNINPLDFIIENDIFTIHKVDKDYNITLEFIDDYPIAHNKIDVWGFYETQLTQKLYWADGANPLAFINIADPNSIELNKKFLSTVPSVTLKQPEIIGYVNGGSHTSGSIQYAYNLYKLNGAQTKISPLSEIAYLNTGDKGQDVNITVDKSIKFSITNIDTLYDRIKVYSIKYNSLDSTPIIKLIYENVISPTLELIDDNNTNLANVSLPEFLFLGGDEYIPKHIFIKDNRLFQANYKTQEFDIDFDAKAYRFDENNVAKIINNGVPITFNKNNIPSLPDTVDAINPTNKAIEGQADWNKYVWKENPIILDPGSTTETDATFADLFSFLNTNVQENILYFTNDDQPASEQNHDYTTTEILTTTTYTINPVYLAIAKTVDGISTGISVRTLTCNSYINYPGDWEWGTEILNNGTILQLYTKFTSSGKCTNDSVFIHPKPITITLENNTINNIVSFSMYVNNTTSPSATPFIQSFNSGGIKNTIVTPPTLEGGVLGGIGPNLEFEIKYKTVPSNIGEATLFSSPSLATENIPSEFTSLKSGEVYRMFIEFQLDNGKFLFPKWIADVKIPEIGTHKSLPPVDNLGNINYCYIETKLLNVPNDSRIVAWRTCIVERSEFDKTVITQGILNPLLENKINQDINLLSPSYIQRTVRNSVDIPQGDIAIGKPQRFNTSVANDLSVSSNTTGNNEVTSQFEDVKISLKSGIVYSPEIILNKNLFFQGGRIRKIGLIENKFSDSYREFYDANGVLVDTLPHVPGDVNVSRNEFLQGANLLLNIGLSNNSDASRYGKLIADNKRNTDVVYSKKKLAFVRYFGGIKYARKFFDSTNNMSVSSRIGIVQPISNTFVISQLDTTQPTVKVTGNPGILIKYPGATIVNNFNYYTGTGIVVNQLDTMGIVNYPELSLADTGDFGVLVEFYRQLNNQYGGNTYNARQLNRTIPYSKVLPLSSTTSTNHVGDTYIQKFNFLKTFKGNQDGHIQISEIISFPVETSINLDLRWDILKSRPDNFDADELTSYGFNLAYNQKNNTIKGITKPLNFTELNEFPVNIIPSKLKIAGELIDSFTDFLVNDIHTLDGKYGEITGTGEHKDNVFAFQRKAVAYLSINPRVQIQANDSIPIELGSGGIIERHQYITTNSGTLNKWSVVQSNNGIMYVDVLNKSINFISADNNKMSTVNGIYNKLYNYVDTHVVDLKVDNPVIGKGIISFYDNLKEETYFTFLTNNPFTISYNGLAQGFVSYYDFFPKHYLTVNSKLITTNDNKTLWEHNTPNSLYNTFYNNYFPSYVTIITNDNPDINKIFDNIHFNSEFYDNSSNLDLPQVTFNKLQLWNEFQDTGEITINPLDYRTASKRRLRKWNFIIPRDADNRNRISNPWVHIKLQFDKTALPAPLTQQDIRLVLHDMLISYTAKP